MVELQPSKLITWVRFPSPAPFSSAHIAQEVEHFLGKEEVTGSNPVMGSIWLRPAHRAFNYKMDLGLLNSLIEKGVPTRFNNKSL
jgi:hypothetical protein